MMCERCGKKAATVYYTDIQDGKFNQFHLCKNCAAEMGVTHASSPASQLGISDLLAGMLDEVSAENESGAPSACGTCGMAFGEFREGGRLGCPDCYGSFAESLRHLLRRIHGSNQHEGKVPSSELRTVEEKREVRRLKDLLQKAVESEEFERAAEIRDQLRELESGLGGRRKG